MTEFEIQATSENSLTLAVSGRIDSVTAILFRHAMQEAVKHARHIILNLSSVDYINSAGLREIVYGYNALQQVHREICIIQPTEQVFESLNMAGLDTLLSVFDRVEDATKRFE